MTLHDTVPGTADDRLPERRATLARLLDENPALRAEALAEAVSRHWIDTIGRTVVWAVLLDEELGARAGEAFGHHLAAAAPARATFFGPAGGTLHLLTRDAAADGPFDDWIHSETARVGLPVRAIGSAQHDWASGDLAESARRARVAADLTAALPELRASSSIDELGGWVMLHTIAAGTLQLGDISPAADALLRSGDDLQRHTVETYLDAGGRTSAACERLHIHRTTLYYRLDNMPEVVREALGDGLKRSTLHLSLKLMRLWGATAAR